MNYKVFIYCGILSIIYGEFLKNELNSNWIEVKSIVTNVEVKDNVLKNVNGINIAEVESHAYVVYKINDEVKKSFVSVVRSQPVQIGNIIPIEYNENDRKRKEKNIPSHTAFLQFGIVLFIIAIFAYKNTEN